MTPRSSDTPEKRFSQDTGSSMPKPRGFPDPHDNMAAAYSARPRALRSNEGWDTGRWRFKAEHSRYGVRRDGSAGSPVGGELVIPARRVHRVGEGCCPLREGNGVIEVVVKVEYVLIEVWIPERLGGQEVWRTRWSGIRCSGRKPRADSGGPSRTYK
jgi:hypothetical protein